MKRFSMCGREGVLVIGLTIGLAFSTPPAAAESVDLNLVLVTDVSRSIDDTEFELEKAGYAAAFVNPQVLGAIRRGAIGSIAVAYIEFAGNYEVRTVIDFTVIREKVDRGELGVKTGRGFHEWSMASAEALKERLTRALIRAREDR